MSDLVGATFKGPSEIELREEVDRKNLEYYISLVISAKASFTRHLSNSNSSLDELLKIETPNALRQALRSSISLYQGF